MQQQAPQNVAQQRPWHELALVVLPAAGVALVAFWLAFQFVEPAPPSRIVMSTGGAAGGYSAFGERYRTALARAGITVEVRTSAGSVENLARLHDGAMGVDLALVQGGVAKLEDADGLVSLGRVFLEPLWVFYRDADDSDRLSTLAGRRIAVGEQGSGTRALSLALLEANNISSDTSTLVALSGQKAVDALLAGDVDAAFLVLAPEASLVQGLLRRRDVKLMSFAQAEAYTRIFPYLTRVTLPQGMVDLVENLPPRDVTMVAAEAALVARGDLHPALVSLLVEAAREIHGSPGTFHRFRDYPKPSDPEFVMSEDADRVYAQGPPFLQRFLPFWLATFLERMAIMILPIATILLPLIKIVPMVYDWRIRSRILHWYGQLKKLEKRLAEDRAGARTAQHLAEINHIDEAVATIPVPLIYSADFYDLRGAVDLVRQRILAMEKG